MLYDGKGRVAAWLYIRQGMAQMLSRGVGGDLRVIVSVEVVYNGQNGLICKDIFLSVMNGTCAYIWENRATRILCIQPTSSLYLQYIAQHAIIRTF